MDRIREISKGAKDTYVTSNNHNVGKGPANALEIAPMLGSREVDAPPTLIEAYPVLREFTRS